jgi:prepilin-type N-terminal cleavage/methylation domain-containing protein
MTTSRQRGFTLVEILVVVVIIGILAAIAIPKFASTKDKAYVAQMKSDLRNLVTAEAVFFADSARYSVYDTSMLKYRTSTGVNTPAITTGVGYWSATITHSTIAGFSCGIGINTPNPVAAAAGEGEPVCK